MRIRRALRGLLIVGVMTACSSGSDTSDAYCEQLTATSHRLASAEQDLFTGGAKSQAALARIVGELQGLQRDAPREIRSALDRLGTAFQRAEQAIQHPAEQGREQLDEVAAVLAADGKTVSDYVTSKCN